MPEACLQNFHHDADDDGEGEVDDDDDDGKVDDDDANGEVDDDADADDDAADDA